MFAKVYCPLAVLGVGSTGGGFIFAYADFNAELSYGADKVRSFPNDMDAVHILAPKDQRPIHGIFRLQRNMVFKETDSL